MAYNKRRKTSKRTETYKGKGEDTKGKSSYREKYNDPSWYIREGQLAKDVASFSFNNALGARCVLNGDNAFGSVIFGSASQNIPGIMVIHTGPAVHPSNDESSAINMAAKNLYTFVRHQNSGHSNYESSDMMLYVMAMDSAYAFSAWMTRMYGMLRTYSQVNRFVGFRFVEACGGDPTKLASTLADFRAYINIFNTKLSAFCTPSSMGLFKRHWWMYSGIFADEDIAKAQVYIYNPAFLWQWDETSGSPAYLKAVPIGCSYGSSYGFGARTGSSLLDLAGIKTMGDALIGALVGSEDINIMSGDILKAYGRENVWSLGMVSEDYAVVPVYSEEILDQIHNTLFTGRDPVVMADLTVAPTASIASLNLTQSVNAALVDYITYKPQFRSARHLSIEHFLDMADNEPTPERVLVATRNMAHGISDWNTIASTPVAVTTLDSCGSDICIFGSMYYFDSTGAIGIASLYGNDYQALGNAQVNTYTKFRRAPIIYQFLAQNNHNIQSVVGPIGNYTIVDASDVDKIHESALLSMLGVPV